MNKIHFVAARVPIGAPDDFLKFMNYIELCGFEIARISREIIKNPMAINSASGAAQIDVIYCKTDKLPLQTFNRS